MKWTRFFIALFLNTQITLYNTFAFIQALFTISKSFLTFTHIHALMAPSGANLGLRMLRHADWSRSRTTNFWLADDLLSDLSRLWCRNSYMRLWFNDFLFPLRFEVLGFFESAFILFTYITETEAHILIDLPKVEVETSHKDWQESEKIMPLCTWRALTQFSPNWCFVF